jgi:hypothetical protein
MFLCLIVIRNGFQTMDVGWRTQDSASWIVSQAALGFGGYEFKRRRFDCNAA